MEKLLEAETFVPGRNAQVEWGKSDRGLPPSLVGVAQMRSLDLAIFCPCIDKFPFLRLACP